MLFPLLASAAILAGVGNSHFMGEAGPFAIVMADARKGDFGAEVGWDSAAKLETSDGWRVHGSADYWQGAISVGLGYSHRHTSQWTKDRLWVRASVKQGIIRLIAQAAPNSKNMEAMAELRVRMQHKRFVLEPRSWIGWHSTAEELGGYAYGLSILVGVGHPSQ